ncbi:MAG: SPFH domain-containing protein [Clostridia bacterium]|nr:SPFH domain-containing protein [Clostridia bacterium]
MGLLKAGIGALSGVLADQWREYFYCEALDAQTLVKKGKKRTSSRSSNTKGSDNVISNGSIIAVADGQCMIIVEQGKVVDLCAEPGEFVYDTSTEPSLLYGGLNKENILKNFATVGKRFTFGGEPAKDQRVYYFNTKEIYGNRYGTQNPVPFRVVDKNIGLDVDIAIRCNGEYSYKIIDPLMFYTNVCGNVSDDYTRDLIDSQLKTELLTALQPAFAKISEMGIRYSALPSHTEDLSNALNEVLSKKWTELRGIAIYSFGINSVTASKEDEDMIKSLQRKAVYRDATMGAAAMVDAQAEAMQAAAKNEAGAFTGFMGMGMAMNAGGGGNAAANLYAMGQQQQPQQQYQQAPYQQPQQPDRAQPQNPAAGGWVCACGTANTGKFCMNCGASKPAGAPLYRCDKCGWTPEDPHNPPRFCPECGDPFDENDAK